MTNPTNATQLLTLDLLLNKELLDYTLSYFQDKTSDFSFDAITDFIHPILQGCQVQPTLIKDIIQKLSDGYVTEKESKPMTLDKTMTMKGLTSNTLTFTQNQKIDIRHGSTKIVKSQVDQKKLLQAEKKLAEKRAQRGVLEDEILPWNPNVKPAIIVNQMKAPTTESKSKDIRLENFDINYAGKKILTNANLSLTFGQRYGLVGKNGVGKSTLLRAIANRELYVPSHIRILHVEQEASGDDTSAIQSVLDADEERLSLLKEEADLQSQLNSSTLTPQDSLDLNSKLKSVYQRLQDIEADKAEARASSILSGLGFNHEQQQAAGKTFSGGWRMRLALARALFCRPDLLLADEVTNFLDFPAVVWLEKYFQEWKTTLLVVSHDRSFLDSVSTDILHLHDGKLDHYRGNFHSFVATKNEKRKNERREYESQLQYRQHLQAFIDRWRYNAKRSAQAQSKIKILEKLGPLIEPAKDEMEGMGEGLESVYFTFPQPEGLSPPIIQADQVSFGYDSSRTILSNVSFDLRMDSKIAIVGPNGAGKSTFIKLLTGSVEPVSGRIYKHGRLRVALFSQHHVDQLDLSKSSVAFLASQYPGLQEEEYRRVLGRFGLTGTTALQPIGTLSGGQKSRTVFAWMAMSQPHILVLDEPTNHLDMDSIDALSKALISYQGGVLIVSHDQSFCDSICQEIWICDKGTLSQFHGKEGDPHGIVYQYKTSLLK